MVQKLKEIHISRIFFSKLLLLSFLFCIFTFGKVLCQSNIKLNLTVGVGTYFSFLNKGFLEEYNTLIGGQKVEFLHQFAPSIGLYVSWNEDYSVSLNTSFINFKLQENFSKETYENSNIYRIYFEDLNVTTIPIYFAITYSDYNQKYRSFIQLGAGMSFSGIVWKEIVNSPIPNDIRNGGTIFNEQQYYPTVLTKLGIELLFDKGSVPKFISGINFSSNIVYVVRYSKIFEKLTKQYFKPPPTFNEKHSVIPLMIGINFGILLNLDNEKINRVFGYNN